MNDTTELQTVISVSDMAQRVGLSRQRFTQLVSEGVFPPPVYDGWPGDRSTPPIFKSGAWK